MKIIGITGGVGSGKSRVLAFMEEAYHAGICQADHVAWELQKPGQVCYEKIISHFGHRILREDGTIDRGILGNIVFGNSGERKRLNRIVHPEVKREIRRQINRERERGRTIFVVEAALLIEDRYDEICDELWYIYAEETVRRSRLAKSRGYSMEKIDAMMAAQSCESYFREHCDIVIDNSGEFEKTQQEIEKVMDRQEKVR